MLSWLEIIYCLTYLGQFSIFVWQTVHGIIKNLFNKFLFFIWNIRAINSSYKYSQALVLSKCCLWIKKHKITCVKIYFRHLHGISLTIFFTEGKHDHWCKVTLQYHLHYFVAIWFATCKNKDRNPSMVASSASVWQKQYLFQKGSERVHQDLTSKFYLGVPLCDPWKRNRLCLPRLHLATQTLLCWSFLLWILPTISTMYN